MTDGGRRRWAGLPPPTRRSGGATGHPVRPIRLTRLGSAVLTVTLIGSYVAASGTDADMLALVGVVAAGLVVIGLVWPVVSVARAIVQVDAPRRARVGEDVRYEVSARRAGPGVRVRLLDPSSTWSGTLGRDLRSSVRRREDARGMRTALRVEVRADGPVGLASVGWARLVPLAAPLDVGPEIREGTLDLDEALGVQPTPATGRATAGDLVRSVRPYEVGDPARLVHWATTARTGTLVVRELEPPADRKVAVRVDLRDLGRNHGAVASTAAEVVDAALAAGAEVHLATSERGFPVSGRVRSRAEATRRLARAAPGPPGTIPAGWPLVEARDWWLTAVAASHSAQKAAAATWGLDDRAADVP